MKNIYKLKTKVKTILFFVVMPLFFLFMLYVYYQKAVAFSFIDEFNNFMAGYYILQGKSLYSQIFFQHQPLMAYMSAFIQLVLHPDTLYKLILYHRIFIIFVSILFDILLIYRFSYIGVAFSIFFELSKFYLFGSLFLGESFIVYPIVYLFGLAWEKLQKKVLSLQDILISGFFTFLVVCTREPFIPVTLCLYGYVLIGKLTKSKAYSICFFLFLTSLTLLTLPLRQYMFDIITVNYNSVALSETAANGIRGIGIFQIFIYPFLLFFGGSWNILREIIVLCDVMLLGMLIYAFYIGKRLSVLFILFFLGLAAVRIVTPGTIYFSAYHILPWYGLFIMSLFLLLSLFYTKKYKRIFIVLGLYSFIICLFMLFSTQSFIFEKNNRSNDFTTNYERYFVFGSVIHALAKPTDTVFVDSWDSLIYWQAKQPVAYPYIFYYVPMNNYPIFTNARVVMFKNNPPDFYYFYCGETKYYSPGIPNIYKNEYKQLYNITGPSCLYVLTKKIPQISQNQWNSAKQLGFYLP